jgi:3-oxoacyl-[acyl-carrier-protein] synthase III
VYTPETLLAEIDAAQAGQRNVRLAGLGTSLPEREVANPEIAARAGVDEPWIVQRTGIHARRHASPDLRLVDLAADAALAALRDAALQPHELDLVLVATVSQEQPMPNVAPQLAAKLGATTPAAFDLGAACSGFIVGLATAAGQIEAGRARNVLLVGADLLSRQTDPHDRSTAALFGDGAAAAVLSASRGAGRWSIELGSDGRSAALIETDRDSGLIRMNGHDTFIQAVSRLEQATRSVCADAGADVEDIDLFVFHQANARITRTLAQRLGLKPSQVVDCIAQLGNTSAASVPLALAHARAQGRLSGGEKVLLAAVGAGLTWGAVLLEWERP